MCVYTIFLKHWIQRKNEPSMEWNGERKESLLLSTKTTTKNIRLHKTAGGNIFLLLFSYYLSKSYD